MQLSRLTVVLLIFAAASACHDSTAPSAPSYCGPTDPKVCSANRSVADSANRSVAEMVVGAWTQVRAANGTSLQVHLSANDTTLSGSGTYSTTPAAVGAVEIRGFVFWRDSLFAPSGFVVPAEPVVVLDFTFDDGRTARFDQAILAGADTLNGVLTFSEDKSYSYGISFARSPTP
jgi:hypothetical protein